MSDDIEYTINRQHRLARGLVSFWLPSAPHRRGGLRLWDLLGRNHGTLSGATWDGRGVLFAAGTQKVNLPTQSSGGPLKPPLPLSMFAFIRTTSLAATQYLFTNDTYPAAANYYGASFAILSSGKLATNYGSGGVAGPANRRSADFAPGTPAVVLNNPSTVSCSIRGATDVSAYINGIDCGTPTYTGTGGALAYSSSAPVIGNTTASDNDFIGTIFAVGFWNRSLSDVEHRQLAFEARNNYPTLLNRTRSSFGYVAASPPSGDNSQQARNTILMF
jgi:hypothetical protein